MPKKTRTLLKNLVHFFFKLWFVVECFLCLVMSFFFVSSLDPNLVFWLRHVPKIEIPSRFFQSFAIFLLLGIIFDIFHHFQQLWSVRVTCGAHWVPPYGHPIPWVPCPYLIPWGQPYWSDWGKFETLQLFHRRTTIACTLICHCLAS